MNVYEVKLIRLKRTLGDPDETIEVCYYVASHIAKVWEAIQPELNDEGVEVLSLTGKAGVLAVLG